MLSIYSTIIYNITLHTLVKRNPIVDAILTPDMRKWLINGIKPSTYNNEINIAPTQSSPRPTTSKSGYIVIKATIASETAKAYNFKVELDQRKYSIRFPFNPSLYIWMPKKCCNKIDHNYWEVLAMFANENLSKAMVQLKKKLIDSYGFEASEIVQIGGIHLA